MFRICSDACSEEQKAEGTGPAHTVSCARHAEVRPVGHFSRGGLSSSLAQPPEKLSGRYFVASGFGLLHGETTEWAVLRIQILYVLIKHLKPALEHI